jgi:hypothetical protein
MGPGRQGPELAGSGVGSVASMYHQQPQQPRGQQQYTHLSRAAVNGAWPAHAVQHQAQGQGLGVPPPHATMTGGELHI